MLSSICFSLTRPLTTQVYSTLSNATEYSKNHWPIVSGDAVFHACNYRNMSLVVYRKDIDKSYIFTSDGYDWIPLQS